MPVAPKKLKYADQIRDFTDCPARECSPKAGVAFRWVNNPLRAEDFLPHAIRWPDEERNICCKGYAISLFESQEKAVARYKELASVSRRFKERTGDHIATGNLEKKHGIGEPSNDDTSHFSFFENAGVDLMAVFQVVERIEDA